MSTPSQAPVTPERIMQLAWGYVPPLVMEAAIRHRVFDMLDEGPKSIPELSAATGASERGLTAIANALVGMSFLEKDDAAIYSLTPESAAFLVSTKPGFHGGMLRHGTQQLIPKWLAINEIVATGKPAAAVNAEKEGVEFFKQFVNDIFPMAFPAAQALCRHLKLETGKILDLAAGSGVWVIGLAQNVPGVRVTAVDWPEVIPVTRETVGRHGLTELFDFVGGDLLEAEFGSGYDVATLGHILHSEGQERSRALLAKTFDALAGGGTIAIAEFLVNQDRRGPLNGLFFAVNMIVNTDAGDTYSFEEISAWLESAGFVNARKLEAPGPSPLILANKPLS